ncbi:MAG TPA: hypothetical protein VFB32_04230 [Rudaea sp.]|jgi:hypothetical protein|nr:hypothetical protein [Rudaea sp.]
MKYPRPSIALIAAFALVFAVGCDDGHGPFKTPWHAEKLASGKTIKVTSLNLVWGAEHDDHTLGKDCFAIEYVALHPDAEGKDRQAEADEVFELIRPVSEQWGFDEATVAAIPKLEHRGPYDVYWYRRQPDSHWSSTAIFQRGEWVKNALSSPPH